MLFYASVEINMHMCSTPPFLLPSLKGKGKSTLAYMQHILGGLFGQCEKISTRLKFISPVFFSHELISMSGINIFLV